ncbi:MAG: DUF2889 domain-containing protein [Candidatus Binatia bacterium]
MSGTELHTRTLSIETRPLAGDRLYVHAELRDVRHVDLPAYMGIEHPKGVVHHMALDVELDAGLVIRRIDARMATAPFEPSDKTRGEGCRHILPAYGRLVGVKVDAAYPLRVLEAVGGRQGCFHILSLAQCLPAAVRAATRRLCAGALRMPAGAREEVLDSCSQWRRESPLWQRAAESEGTGFADFRRRVRVTASTDEGFRLAMSGVLRDEAEGAPPAGAELRLVLELPKFSIVSARARLDPAPFPGCEAALEGIGDLHRLSINKGFTALALEKIGGGAGCAHVTALLVAITPVTAQAAGALAGFLGLRPEDRPREGRANPQVDSCHMWRADGPLLALGRVPSGRTTAK